MASKLWGKGLTLKQLRRQLKAWGQFWQQQEQPKGFNGTSSTARVIEQARTGIWASTDRFSSGGNSSSIRPPYWVTLLDELTDQLSQEQRRVLNKRYIKGHTLSTCEKLVLLYAEIELTEKINFELNSGGNTG